ncbi:hypothetical protein IAT40_005017 [Kwoniella sp. CBS 6097]
MCRNTDDPELYQAFGRPPTGAAYSGWRRTLDVITDDQECKTQRLTKLLRLNRLCGSFAKLHKALEESARGSADGKVSNTDLSAADFKALEPLNGEIDDLLSDLYGTEMNQTKMALRRAASQLDISGSKITAGLDQVGLVHLGKLHLAYADNQNAMVPKQQSLSARLRSHLSLRDPIAVDQQLTEEALLSIDQSLRGGADVAIFSVRDQDVSTNLLSVRTPNPFVSTEKREGGQVPGQTRVTQKKLTMEPYASTTLRF